MTDVANAITKEERLVVEMGKRHIREEKENNFRPHPMLLLGECEKLFRIYLKRNADGGMRETRRTVLRYLSRNANASQKDIVEFGHFSAPSISGEILSMEKDGLIEKRRDEKDGRAFSLSLTAEGKRLDRAQREEYCHLADTVLSALSDKEREQFFSYLYKIRDRILSGSEG